MITENYIFEIIKQQEVHIADKHIGMIRDDLHALPDFKNFAIIVTGVRRCGKSTLMLQLLKQKYEDALYLNFDDPRLFDFVLSDFQKLDRIIAESSTNVLMFDEIQVIKGWERYVRQKLDEGFKVFITGSNASLLSVELGTSLTGRHLSTELFPFSFNEFCRYKSLKPDADAVREYMRLGGFPEQLETEYEGQLALLLEDILVRDIAIRYGVKDTKVLMRLAVYLLSNIGNLSSAAKLREPANINSTTTVLEYLSHLENSYLFSLVPMFDNSLKKQAINPKKIYAIDTGLVNANVSKLKTDDGHKLENMVFCALRRKYKEIYYHKGEKGCECDFLTIAKAEITQAVQVCYVLNHDNMEREFKGLVDALKTYKLTKGMIVTFDQNDYFDYDGCKIEAISFAKFASKLNETYKN